MRLFIFSIIAAFSLAISAYADPPQEGPQNQAQGQAQGQGQLQGQKQGQLQGQLQGQGQAQKSYNKNKNTAVGVGVGVAGVKNSGSTVTTTVEGDDIDPPAYAPNVSLFSPTTKCYVPLGGSVGALGMVSLGAGGAYQDENCTAIEKAKACTEAMKVFPDMSAKCRGLWNFAMMGEDEKEAFLEDKAARLAARKMRNQQASTAPVSLLSTRETIAWHTERIGGLPAE